MKYQRSFRFLVVMLALFVLSTAAAADLILFKDGYMIHGKVKQVSEVIADGGQAFVMPKGTYFLDEGVRRIFFSHQQIEDVFDKDLNLHADTIRLETHVVGDRTGLSPIIRTNSVSAWDDSWDRVAQVQTIAGVFNVKQRIKMLTPQIVRIEAKDCGWSSGYMTSELGVEMVLKLLSTHPLLKLKGDDSDGLRRLAVYQFLFQAGWLDEAEKELEAIAKDRAVPSEKVEVARAQLKKVRALGQFDDLKIAFRTGRHQFVQKGLAAFNADQLDEKKQAELRALKANYETASKNIALARRQLKEVLVGVTAKDQQQLFKEATEAIQDELHVDNISRLEPFITMSLQEERNRKNNRPAVHGPDQLLAFAVTGWLQGKESAESKVETAQKLWTTRRFVLEYQKGADLTARQKLLRAYEQQSELPFDELGQLIRFLPPPEPEKDLGTTAVTFSAQLPGERKGPSYIVQLPPEYHHGRSYPVLFVLHNREEKPLDMLNRFSKLAARHGYILVAPHWQSNLQTTYRYSAEEHGAVTTVLRDLFRRFQVDSDRVFMAGLGEGGNMAFDVGLSHPDLFAGVMPISARPRLPGFVWKYQNNSQNLPLYVVSGEHVGDAAKENRRMFEPWLRQGYPALNIVYKGRGPEWFEGELPNFFDWMDQKKGTRGRSRAFPDMGRDEYQTSRHTDNRFYWLSTESIDDRSINDMAKWNVQIHPAALHGRISAEENTIRVTAKGVKQVTVWLGKDMIDFNRPVTVRINTTSVRWNNKHVKPSLATLLEDFHNRGDRQRLFWARLDFDMK